MEWLSWAATSFIYRAISHSKNVPTFRQEPLATKDKMVQLVFHASDRNMV